MADQVHWQFSGDYFENCSCTVVCPCLVSKSPPLTSRPTQGVCNVPLIFHIESGRFGDIVLDGLNVALAVHTPGPMAEGNWSVAVYIDQRADDKQTEALGAIFTGAAGGPMAQLAPLIGKNLGVRKVPITYRIEGKKRSAEIPDILHMSVDPLPTAHPSGEMWANMDTLSAPKSWRSPWERREIHLTITGCAGIILAKTDITRLFVGRTARDLGGTNVHFWHKADISRLSFNLRFRG